ncbi:hypothetical protein B0A54_04923 [Friedmanniomyces endolithicus]|uniref:Uncharacterized protein n=1 Tax=Friedmanniomyces endolithicus TaxID=329885 RepID=A0A4U0V877_9PEZI|nr:hypothetical protein B0A54_04923 [Friedmanniomyces endolithicus]
MPLLLETLLETVAGRGPGSAVLDHLVNFGGGAGRLDEVGVHADEPGVELFDELRRELVDVVLVTLLLLEARLVEETLELVVEFVADVLAAIVEAVVVFKEPTKELLGMRLE